MELSHRMTETPKPRGVIHCILAKGADLLVKFDRVPAENVEAFRAQFIRVMEQAINDSIGTDTVPLSGWAITPSARQERRERIIEALRRGEAIAAIASSELVSVSMVYKLRQAAGLE